jgi:cysteinyl-tRNA synthetase
MAAPVLAALLDDLNTPQAIAELHQLDDARPCLAALGFKGDLTDPRAGQVDRGRVEALVAQMCAARAAKDYPKSDAIRADLAAMGIAVKVNKDNTASWEVKR